MTTEHDLPKNIRDVNMCTEFNMFKAKVPIIFLGTVGSRYVGKDVTNILSYLCQIPRICETSAVAFQ